MKRLQLLHLNIVAVAILLAGTTIGSAQSLPTYAVTEGPTGLTTTVPGAIILGTQDNWLVALGSGDFWGPTTTPLLAEPENPALMNILTFPTLNSLSWVSDVTANGATGLPTSITDDLLGPTGGPIATVVFTDLGDRSRQVPDGGLTSLLLAGAAGSLAFLRRHLR